MNKLIRSLSVLAVLALGSLAFAGADKKAEDCSACKDAASCCKAEKKENASCCKAGAKEKKADKKAGEK
jgi:hypothetical protein